MKKVISLLIICSLISLPALAQYDFSDEAQAEFDRNHGNIIIQSNDFSKTKNKTEIKNNEDRTHYEPSKELLIDLPEIWEPSPIQQTEIERPIQTQIYPQQLYGSVVKVPAGTSFDVTFDSGISSGSLDKNDRLTVRLTDDLIYNGKVIAPAGSLVYGTATDAKNAGYAYGSGMIELNFNQILTPDGNMLNISTKKIYLKAKSERAVKMTRDVVVGALGSMLVGAAFTALGGSHDWGRNMLIYGSIGAAGGGIHGAMQRGEEISIPDGTTIKVTLTDELTTEPYSYNF